MSKVSVGPSISMDLIEQRSTISKNAKRPFEDILSDFKGKIDKRIKRVKNKINEIINYKETLKWMNQLEQYVNSGYLIKHR